MLPLSFNAIGTILGRFILPHHIILRACCLFLVVGGGAAWGAPHTNLECLFHKSDLGPKWAYTLIFEAFPITYIVFIHQRCASSSCQIINSK